MKIFELFEEISPGVLFEEQGTSGSSGNGSSSGADAGSSDSGGDSGAGNSNGDSDSTGSSQSNGTTTSGNVASVIYPLGSLIHRPYFNYIRPTKKSCKHGKNKDGTCKKKSGKKS